MPWKVEKDVEACSADKPWAVKNSNTGSVNGRCHASKAKAQAQQRALYAAMNRGEMNSELSFLIPTKGFAESLDEDVIWIQAFPFDTWDHPIFGETTVDAEVATRYKQNFDSKVRGQELATDYEHGLDPAKGGKASGWIRGVDVRNDGLWFGINFTETAKEEISKGEWKYFSAEIADEWEHPHTKEVFKDVIIGGGLTNRPWVKGMVPINFSELFEEKGGNVGDEETKNESKEMEHSEPGTGSPPVPRTDEDGSDSKDITSGSRRDTPPVDDPEAKVKELDSKLRETLGLDPDADIIKAVAEMKEEVEPLREAAKAHSEKKAFAEAYPDEFARLQRLEKVDRENTAKAFAENYERFSKKDGETVVKTTRGFSQLVVDKIEALVLKSFSEKITPTDVADVLDLIADGGIVEFGEKGSSRQRSTFNAESDNPRKAFAELVTTIQSEDKLSYADAVTEAAKREPAMFDAYRVARPVE